MAVALHHQRVGGSIIAGYLQVATAASAVDLVVGVFQREAVVDGVEPESLLNVVLDGSPVKLLLIQSLRGNTSRPQHRAVVGARKVGLSHVERQGVGISRVAEVGIVERTCGVAVGQSALHVEVLRVHRHIVAIGRPVRHHHHSPVARPGSPVGTVGHLVHLGEDGAVEEFPGGVALLEQVSQHIVGGRHGLGDSRTADESHVEIALREEAAHLHHRYSLAVDGRLRQREVHQSKHLYAELPGLSRSHVVHPHQSGRKPPADSQQPVRGLSHLYAHLPGVRQRSRRDAAAHTGIHNHRLPSVGEPWLRELHHLHRVRHLVLCVAWQLWRARAARKGKENEGQHGYGGIELAIAVHHLLHLLHAFAGLLVGLYLARHHVDEHQQNGHGSQSQQVVLGALY